MTTSHTPDGWVKDQNRIEDRTGKRIATCSPEHGDYMRNSRLIASAPDLLAALETLLFNALHGNGLDALQQGHAKARAAIAKALNE